MTTNVAKKARRPVVTVLMLSLVFLLPTGYPELEASAGGEEPFLEIISPGPDRAWRINDTVVISWRSRGVKGLLSAELFRKRRRLSTLFRGLEARQGAYSFQLTGRPGLNPGDGYQVRITSLPDGRSWTSAPFSIISTAASAPIRPPLKKARPADQPSLAATPAAIELEIISPRFGERWQVFEEYTISWLSRGLSREDEIALALRDMHTRSTQIIGTASNSGEYKFQVPYPVGLFGQAIQLILAPLRDRGIEFYSEPFAILLPQVDLVCNTPAVSFEIQRRKRKWWEHVGDLFSFGLTNFISEVVELSQLKAKGTEIKIEFNLVQRGGRVLEKVEVDCAILSKRRLEVHRFQSRIIPRLAPNRLQALSFSGRTREMELKPGVYLVEILLDPLDRLGELERLRENNRIEVQFEVR